MEGMESSFPQRENEMGRTEHLFLSIPLKPQIFILSEIGRNMREYLMIFLLKLPKYPLYIQLFILK